MRPLHVVILAAGQGSRLGALGERTPKWLLPVGEKTIADHQLAGIAAARARESGCVSSVRVITGHAHEAIERYLGTGEAGDVTLVRNDDYARLNNWYSVLLALRSIREPEPRVVVINADLFAGPEWFADFIVACARSEHDSLIAIDLARDLTDESMKVSVTGDDRQQQRLSAIGKVGVTDAAGEYVGMLMGGGAPLGAFRLALESFEGRVDAADEWYERAVAVSATKGAEWVVWPTPGSKWVEIDDDADHAWAAELDAAP